MLGCGILHKNVMNNFDRPNDEIAWASVIFYSYLIFKNLKT